MAKGKGKQNAFQISPRQQKQYERMARLQYDPQLVDESIQRWSRYSEAERERILVEGNAIYEGFIAAIETGEAPDSPTMQALLERWHAHLRYFYEPTFDVLRGLGELYNTEPAFIANFQKLHPELPQFLQQAIPIYVDALEYAEIERMLAEDEAANAGNRLSRLSG